MNEKLVDAILQALTTQRNNALNAAAQLEAQLAVKTAELAEKTAECDELKAAAERAEAEKKLPRAAD